MYRYEIDLVTSGELSVLIRRGLYLQEVSEGLNNGLKKKIKAMIKVLSARYQLLDERHEPEQLEPKEDKTTSGSIRLYFR